MSVQHGLSLCIRLTGEAIDREVPVISPGVFALGSAETSHIVQILYVGRADDDVNGELKRHPGEGCTVFRV
jgi:hypothetical protein